LAVENAADISRRGRELLVIVVGVRARQPEKQSRDGDADRRTQRRDGVHSVLPFVFNPPICGSRCSGTA
jgi:hypothetical protein